MAETIYPQIPTVDIPQASLPNSGKELAFDFNKGEFVLENGKPKVVEGIEALKVWIEKTLRTSRYRYLAYSHNYGCEIEDMIGIKPPLSTPMLTSEVQRVIREALIYDDRITDVTNFRIKRESDWLDVEFEIITVWGQSAVQGVRL